MTNKENSTRLKILNILEEGSGAYISGSDIGKKIGVSRTAIWKGINELKKEGYLISSSTNKGYSLSNENDIISIPGISKYSKCNNFDIDKINLYKSVESTNDLAKKMANEGALDKTILIANEQTKGRGRKGRVFFSPSDNGIYLSILLRPNIPINKSIFYTTSSAVAVCKTIQKLTSLSPSIKWVNDIFIGDKKVCGILTEASTNFENYDIEYIVLGIGINFASSEDSFPEELKSIATSLFKTPAPITRNEFIATLLNELFVSFNNIANPSYLEEYKKLSCVLGKPITIYEGLNTYSALAKDIDPSGGLIVDIDGQSKTLTTGEISIKL